MFGGQIGPVFCALNRHWSTRHTLQKRGDHLPRTCCFEVNKVSCCYWLKRKYINNSFGCPLIEFKAFWALFKLGRILCNVQTIERSLTSFEIIYHRSLCLIHVLWLSISVDDRNGSFNSFILTLLLLLTSYPVPG